MLHFLETNTTEILIKEWSKIRKIRNQSAHQDIVTKNHFIEMLSSYKKLSDSEVFYNMIKIKREYKGLEKILSSPD